MSSDEILARIRHALRNNQGETPLGQAVARLKQPFVVGDGKKWHYEGFVSVFSAVRQALASLDASISPDLPPFLLEPATIARLFGIPLEDFNWQGHSTDDALAAQLARMERKLDNLGRSNDEETVMDHPLFGGQEPVEQGQSQLLRLGQCVRVAGHSNSTLRRAIKDGRLKAHAIGRGRKRPTYGVFLGDLEAYIEASRVDLPDSPRIPTTGVRKKSRHFD